MKDYQKQIVWVDYFDSSISRSAGRRVPSHSATRSPTLEELSLAASKLGLEPAVQRARRPASRYVTGYVQIRKTMKKSELLKKMMLELTKVRSESRKRMDAKSKGT